MQALLAGVAGGLAVAIALTRVWLGVHWLTDVLAGLALGWAWFAVASITFGGRQLRFGAPIEVIQQVDPPHERIAPIPDESSPPAEKFMNRGVGLIVHREPKSSVQWCSDRSGACCKFAKT